jgi:hypothetical protein
MLLSMEEQRQVVQTALHWLESHDLWAYAQTAFPEAEPAQDPNEAEGWDNLHKYREALMADLREGEERP